MTKADSTVAQAIIQQLGGGGRLRAFMRVKQFIYDENSVAFDFPNQSRKRPNWLKITLTCLDSYNRVVGK